MWQEQQQQKLPDSRVLDALQQRADEQGTISTADILELWPTATENLDAVYEYLEDEGLEIDYEAVEEEAEAPTGHIVDFEGIDSDDSVSLYFREVGTIDLLDAEHEVEPRQAHRGRPRRRRGTRRDRDASFRVAPGPSWSAWWPMASKPRRS